MAYTLLVDQADPWVDREKVRREVDLALSPDSGPGAEAAERAALLLAGVVVE